MPQLIDTPESWFRREQRDLYFFKFTDEDENENATDELTKWFRQYLPATKLFKVGPSEYSGYICGGPTHLAVDFDNQSLETFCASWEHPDGKSRDHRWQCWCYPFSKWIEKINDFHLYTNKLTEPQNLRWFDTPKGMFLIGAYKEGDLPSLYDAWWIVCNAEPSLRKYSERAFPCGSLRKRPSEIEWRVLIELSFEKDSNWESEEFEKNPENRDRLRTAFGLAPTTPLNMAIYDF